MALVFVPNPDFERELEADEDTENELLFYAAAAKQIAERIAPRDRGDYARAFEIISWEGDVALSNKDFKAHWVEWGSVNNPAHGVLRRAALFTGARFRVSPKKK